MLFALQTLPCRRGVNLIWYLILSTRFRIPSIQPKQSASSTDSGHLMLGFPESFL
jgi:hypothetical protein